MSALALDKIKLDGGTQSRASIDEAVVEDYAQVIRDGVDFPPVVVFHDGKKYWLADGFHRVEAYRAAGAVEIDADIRQGDRRDAILFSVGANAAHGLRRTNDDKRRAVLTLLNDDEWVKWSDREISRRAGVSNKFVSDLRLTVNGTQTERTVKRGGSTFTMDTANIGKPAVEPDKQAEFDRQRDEVRSQLPPSIQAREAAREERKSSSAKADPDLEELQAQLGDRDNEITSLAAQLEEATAKIAKYDDMVVAYERGGFEAVIDGLREELRVKETRFYSTNQDMISWKNKAFGYQKQMERYKAEAIKRGYSDDIDVDDIDPETGALKNG